MHYKRCAKAMNLSRVSRFYEMEGYNDNLSAVYKQVLETVKNEEDKNRI